jgi:hypothetical protein
MDDQIRQRRGNAIEDELHRQAEEQEGRALFRVPTGLVLNAGAVSLAASGSPASTCAIAISIRAWSTSL